MLVLNCRRLFALDPRGGGLGGEAAAGGLVCCGQPCSHPHRFYQHLTPFKATWHPADAAEQLVVIGAARPLPSVPGGGWPFRPLVISLRWVRPPRLVGCRALATERRRGRGSRARHRRVRSCRHRWGHTLSTAARQHRTGLDTQAVWGALSNVSTSVSAIVASITLPNIAFSFLPLQLPFSFPEIVEFMASFAQIFAFFDFGGSFAG